MHYVYWMLLRFGTCAKYNVDAVPQGRAEWQTLTRAFELLSTAHGQKSEIDFDFASLLFDVPLPGLGEIELADIVSLRQSEECLAFWRSVVSEAVRRIRSGIGISSANLGVELRQVLNERALAVEESIMKTSIGNRFKAGATAFALSSAGIFGSTAAGLVEPGQELAKLGISAVLSALSTLVFGRTPNPRTALRKHIAAFIRR